MTESTVPEDVLNDIAGIEAGSYLAELRNQRPEILKRTQATFLAIFEPTDDTDLSRIEREAVAVWVATLAKAPEVAAFHRRRLIVFGPPSEHLTSLGASVDALNLSPRERALLRHAELLTLRPATAEKSDVDVLLNAGVSPTGAVILAQLVAFLSFEIRTVATLRVLDQGVKS